MAYNQTDIVNGLGCRVNKADDDIITKIKLPFPRYKTEDGKPVYARWDENLGEVIADAIKIAKEQGANEVREELQAESVAAKPMPVYRQEAS